MVRGLHTDVPCLGRIPKTILGLVGFTGLGNGTLAFFTGRGKWEGTHSAPLNGKNYVFQVAAAIAMFVAGCFDEAGIGAPWWSTVMFLVSGLSLVILVKKQSSLWEKCAFVTIILSIITAVAGTIYYSLEFALIHLPQSPFPHDTSDPERLARAYRVDAVELGLAAFEPGVSIWILCLLQQARKTLRQ